MYWSFVPFWRGGVGVGVGGPEILFWDRPRVYPPTLPTTWDTFFGIKFMIIVPTHPWSLYPPTRAEKMAQFLHSNEPKCLGPGFECLSNPMIFHTKHIWSKVKEQKFLLIYLGCPLQLSETKHEFNCAQKELNYVYEKIFWRGWQRGLPTNTCVNR